MTVNEFCSKVHLPSAVAHFGWEAPKYYRKLPYYGWYAISKMEDMTFNAVDLFAYNQADNLRKDDLLLISRCFRYFVQEHPDLLEVPIKYSETFEKEIVNDFVNRQLNERFWKLSRLMGMEGSVTYHAKNWKLPDLLNELGMTKFINAGVGITNYKLINSREFEGLKLHNRHCNKLLIPTYFAPNNKIASLETFELCDLSDKEKIYRNAEPGWYGKIGTNIVGSLRDLMTNDGCVWTPKITPWVSGKILSLHQSLQPSQCIEIWSNLDNIATDKNPLNMLKAANLEEQLKGSLTKLTLAQIGELERVTGKKLQEAWLSTKTSEASVSGTKFLHTNDRYYYCRGNSTIEYTNFAVSLTKITKEDGEYIQHGIVIKDSQAVSFQIKRKVFVSQFALLRALTDIMLEAGIGTPSVAPNLKHYITNVIDAFNPVNLIEKPKPASTPIESNQRALDQDL